MDRQWINIKGRKLLCTEFIYILDRYRCCSLIKSLMEESKIDKSNDKEPENKVRNLLLLQKAKIKSDLYEMDEKEIHITKLWCDLLISSIFSEAISYGQMLRLVENDVVTESKLTELLEDKYNIEKDYEWYAEDFIGCGLEEDTDIKIEDIWQLYTKRMEKIIGIPL